MGNFTQNYRLAEMTSAAFAQAAKANPVILLPLGSHESHGSHLPMGDYVLAEMLAERIAAAATAAGVASFVAPCLPFGVADYFGSVPGGLAISAASFRQILDELLAGLLRHGLTKIVLLNGHGGNVPVIHEVTLAVKNQSGLVVPSFYLWKIARDVMQQRLGPASTERFGHGAEPLLSLSMALRGDRVRPAESPTGSAGTMLGLPVSGFGTVAFSGVGIDVPVEFDCVPQNAAATAWPLASAELGAEVADALVSLGARFVAHVAGVSQAVPQTP